MSEEEMNKLIRILPPIRYELKDDRIAVYVKFPANFTKKEINKWKRTYIKYLKRNIWFLDDREKVILT